MHVGVYLTLAVVGSLTLSFGGAYIFQSHQAAVAEDLAADGIVIIDKTKIQLYGVEHVPDGLVADIEITYTGSSLIEFDWTESVMVAGGKSYRAMGQPDQPIDSIIYAGLSSRGNIPFPVVEGEPEKIHSNVRQNSKVYAFILEVDGVTTP